MSFWKIAAGAAVGVGAIAAAPFTGGGSILGAVTLAGSLAGGGTIAAATVAGVAGASAGYAMSDKDEKSPEVFTGVRNKKSDTNVSNKKLMSKIENRKCTNVQNRNLDTSV